MKNFEEFISHFEVKHSKGDQRQCICPAHADKRASLTITYNRVGNMALMYCHAGCYYEDVLAAKGLTKKDLYFGDNEYIAPKKAAWIQWVEDKTSLKLEKYYHYVDLSGKYCCTKLRFEGKNFIYGILDNESKFHFGLNGRNRKDINAFYCKDYEILKKAISEKKPVFYVEGEKDVDTLFKYGHAAFTCGSAQDWSPGVAEMFKEASQVVIFADNDKPGKELARTVKRDINKVIEEGKVEIIVPALDLQKGDISDFIAIYGKAGLYQLDRRISKGINMFHLVNEKTGKCSGVFDYAIFKYISSTRSIFVIGKMPYIYDNGVYKPDPSGARLKTMIKDLMLPVFIKSNTIKRVYDLFLSDSSLEVSFNDINAYPDEWINFKNGFYDPINKKMVPHHPKYKATNQIPHEYDPDQEYEDTYTIAKWLHDSIPDPEDREMYLQYVGYCLTKDIRHQTMMFIKGKAGTGKSLHMNMVNAAVGKDNISTIPIHKLCSERFAGYGIIDKLLNSCGDLSSKDLSDPAEIKKLTGDIDISVEAKGKDAIKIKVIAKMLFLCNDFPFVKNEESEGFYRRLLILSINKAPETVDPDLFHKLMKGIDYYIRLAVQALERMHESGRMKRSTNSTEAVRAVWAESDSVRAFLNKCTEDILGEKTTRVGLYDGYKIYCEHTERTPKGRNAFYKSVRAKGYSETKTNGVVYFNNLAQVGSRNKITITKYNTLDYLFD